MQLFCDYCRTSVASEKALECHLRRHHYREYMVALGRYRGSTAALDFCEPCGVWIERGGQHNMAMRHVRNLQNRESTQGGGAAEVVDGGEVVAAKAPVLAAQAPAVPVEPRDFNDDIMSDGGADGSGTTADDDMVGAAVDEPAGGSFTGFSPSPQTNESTRSNMDWMNGRDDLRHFGEHALCGEVVLAAFRSNTREAKSLLDRSKNWSKYQRYRIVNVDSSSGAVTLYSIDKYASFSEASAGRATDCNIVTSSLEELLMYATFLGHDDVNRNGPALELDIVCDGCGVTVNRADHRSAAMQMRFCDGNFPTNLTTGIVSDGIGKQYACHRGLLCAECDASHGATAWACKACTGGIAAYGDVWGRSIIVPPSLRGAEAPGTPVTSLVSSAEFRHPADRVVKRAERDAVRHDEGSQRSARAGGEGAIQASATLLGAFRSHNISILGQQGVLGALHTLYTQGLLSGPVEAPLTFPLPKDQRTLESRGEAALVCDGDVSHRSYRINTAALDQLQTEVTVGAGDLPMLIQSIFDDKRIKPSSWFLGQRVRSYWTAAGDAVVGPEIHQGGERWKVVASTVPPGGNALMLNVWSDGVAAQSGNLLPAQITIGNLCLDERIKDAGMRLGAMLGTVKIRAPLGNRAERLRPDQKKTKAQIYADCAAIWLAELDAAVAAGPIEFLIDGERVALHVRLCLYVADLKEKWDVLALRKNSCPRCYGWAHASAKEASAGRGGWNVKNFAHMRTDPESKCATAKRRTAASVLQDQHTLCLRSRSEVAADRHAAKKEASARGVRYDVDVQLNRLTSLAPHATGGVYQAFQPDLLHVFGLGVVDKFLRCSDALFCHRSSLRTHEDVHHLVEELLAAIPPMSTGDEHMLNFQVGWWSGELGVVSAAEKISFFSQLLFIVAGNDDLIPSSTVRARYVKVLMRLFGIYRTLKTPQWMTLAEIDLLDGELDSAAADFRWMHTQLPGDLLPGDGFNIPKVHDFLNYAEVIRQCGSPLNCSTSYFERTNKALKEADRHTRRDDRSGAHNVDLLVRGGRLEEQLSRSAPVGGGMSRKCSRTAASHGRGHIDPDSAAWLRAADALGEDASALAVQALTALGAAAGGAAVEVCGAVRLERGAGRATVLLCAGHAVSLTAEAAAAAAPVRYVQVVAPVIGVGGSVAILARPFVRIGAGAHPETGLPWLKKGLTLELVELRHVERREHIVPIHGSAHATRASVGGAQQYMYNPGTFYWKERVRKATGVWSSCPRNLCNARIQCPPGGPGSVATCGACSLEFRWQ
jgi:hypothetical protein